MIFISKHKDKYIKPWFFSSSEPERIKVPYVIATILMYLLICAIYREIQFQEVLAWGFMRTGKEILKPNYIPVITVLIGSFGGIIALYNWGKKK